MMQHEGFELRKTQPGEFPVAVATESTGVEDDSSRHTTFGKVSGEAEVVDICAGQYERSSVVESEGGTVAPVAAL